MKTTSRAKSILRVNLVGTLALAVAGVLLMALPLVASASAEDRTDTNEILWANSPATLQIGIQTVLSNGAVRCWVRNSTTNEISYNCYGFGAFGSVRVEVHEGTNWTRLDYGPAFQRIVCSAGPSTRDLRKLNPGEVIKLEYYSNYYQRRMAKFGSTTTSALGQRWTHFEVSPPPPDQQGATLVADLLDFEWPKRFLDQRLLHARVSLLLYPVAKSYEQTPPRYEVLSPQFTVDVAQLAALLNQLPWEDN